LVLSFQEKILEKWLMKTGAAPLPGKIASRMGIVRRLAWQAADALRKYLLSIWKYGYIYKNNFTIL